MAAQTIWINGVAYPLTWSTVINWTTTVPLETGTNLLNIVGMDSHGHPIPGGTNSVSVTNDIVGSSPAPLLPIVINEWLADNTHTLADPADSGFEDWFELYNPRTNAVDIGGYFPDR